MPKKKKRLVTLLFALHRVDLVPFLERSNSEGLCRQCGSSEALCEVVKRLKSGRKSWKWKWLKTALKLRLSRLKNQRQSRESHPLSTFGCRMNGKGIGSVRPNEGKDQFLAHLNPKERPTVKPRVPPNNITFHTSIKRVPQATLKPTPVSSCCVLPTVACLPSRCPAHGLARSCGACVGSHVRRHEGHGLGRTHRSSGAEARNGGHAAERCTV